MAEGDFTQDKQQQEPVDFAKVQEVLRSQVDQYMAERETRQQRQPQQPDPQKEVADTVRGFVAGDLNEARLTAADARDYVDFYTNNEDGLYYKDDVEKTFNMLKEAGRPTTRKDILRHVIGDQYIADPVKFKAREDSRKQAQLDRAATAGDIGQAASTREKSTKFANFDSLSSEEMEKALDGVTF